MKRKLFMAALALGMALPSNAQTVFEENFDDGDINNWILGLLYGEGITATPMSPFPAMESIGFYSTAMGATTFEVVNDAAVHVQDVDLLIVTPSIVLPAGNSTLSYRVGSLTVGPGSAHYSMYILTAVDMTGITTVTQLGNMVNTKTAEESANVSGPSSVTSFSLSGYEGQTIRVAFRLHETPSNALLLLDDVKITRDVLDTNSMTAKTFSAYPNPANDILNIRGRDGEHFESLTLADINGRIVATQQLNGSNEGRVDIASLSAGMYLMTITSDKGIATTRIIKQ